MLKLGIIYGNINKDGFVVCSLRAKIKTNYLKTSCTFSDDFCEFVLFSLVSCEVVVCLAILVFYHPWLH